VTQSKDPSIGYSVTYPFGVIVPILRFYFMTRRVRPTFPSKPAQFHLAEVTMANLPEGETTLRELIAFLPAGRRSPASGRSIAISSRSRTPRCGMVTP
jgi:putative transport protein